MSDTPRHERPLRMLFVVRSRGYARTFLPALRLLRDRGHEIKLVSPARRIKAPDGSLVPRRSEDWEGFELEHVALADRHDRSVQRSAALRASLDYLRYFDPGFEHAAKLRARAREACPPRPRRLIESRLGHRAAGRRLLRAVFGTALRALPPGPAVTELLREERPDVVLATPVVDGSRQPEFILAAQRLGIPAVACVRSWDNLSTKALFHCRPTLVTVWNETMRREAVEMHGLDPETVVVTGAQKFDAWFARGPSTTPEEFRARAGLRPDRPFVLYLCSSQFIAPREREAVARWVAALRSRGGDELAGLGVVIRPHPDNQGPWAGAGAAGALGEQVVVYPRPGEGDPDAIAGADEQAVADFYDSIAHAEAVVGVNTSALIEAAIVGTPILTLRMPEFREGQDESIHFSYLAGVGGGMLRIAPDLDTHLEQLAAVLDAPSRDGRPTEFLREFVRPHGLDTPAGPILADAIEGAARR